MHTLIVLLGGAILLSTCLYVSRKISGSMAAGSLIFIALWFVASAVNMWIGVTRAGYTVAQEFPIFLGVFGLPTVVALIVWWRTART